MITSEQAIEQTKQWIADVVIGCNFCPFAAKVVKQQTVFFKVEMATDTVACLETFLHQVTRLDDEAAIETSFLIFHHCPKSPSSLLLRPCSYIILAYS